MMYAQQKLSRDAVQVAHDLIKPLINRTPVLVSEALSKAATTRDLKIKLFFKCENLQKSGSFKFRGASNFIAQQSDDQLQKGLVAVSTGNFGFAVALAAQTASVARSIPVQAAVVLPSKAAQSKVAGAKKNGAQVVLAGSTNQDRDIAARSIVRETGATLVGPMDDRRIVLGQGTATLEMIEQLREDFDQSLDAMILPSATGGILSGAALVCENSSTMVFGCEPERGGPDLRHGLRENVLPSPRNQNSVADGLRASCSKGNFRLISDLVDGFYSATEEQIKVAWALLMEELRMIIEPSSAVAVATLLFNDDFRKVLAKRQSCWNIGIILTGGNTNLARIRSELSDADV